mgnify:CR=1 FL=1
MRAFARAPVRVDPAGGGTDAPPFCVDHGGKVVNFGVNRHVFARAQDLGPGGEVLVYSEDLQAGVRASSSQGLPGGGRLELLQGFVKKMVPPGQSLLLVTSSEVPPGSGLGGSGAVGVAVVAALDRLLGLERSKDDTARLANEVERVDLGYPGGSQDSYGAARGGLNLLEYHQGGGMTPRPIAASEESIRRLEEDSLLVFTGAAHVSGSIHDDIRRSYHEAGSKTLNAMFALREAADRMSEGLEAGRLDVYAETLEASCRSLYDLHQSCDSAEHRRVLGALDDLTLAGKTCGAGGGGFLLLYARPGCRQECLERAEALGVSAWPFEFDLEGVRSEEEAPWSEAEVAEFRRLVEEGGPQG